MTTFPRPRSSNRTCGFPSSSIPTRSCLRPRKALGLRRKVDQAVDRPQPFVLEAHVLPFPELTKKHHASPVSMRVLSTAFASCAPQALRIERSPRRLKLPAVRSGQPRVLAARWLFPCRRHADRLAKRNFVTENRPGDKTLSIFPAPRGRTNFCRDFSPGRFR